MQLNANQESKRKKISEDITLVSQRSDELAGLKDTATHIGGDVSAVLAEWDMQNAPVSRKKTDDVSTADTRFFPAATQEIAKQTENTFQAQEATTYIAPSVSRTVAEWDSESNSKHYTPEKLIQETNERISQSMRMAQDIPADKNDITAVGVSQKNLDLRQQSPQIEITEGERIEPYDLTTPLTLETLSKRQKILRLEIEILHKLMIENPDNEELWSFIERCSGFPGSATILRHNLGRFPITEDVLDSIIFLGPVREKVRDLKANKERDIIVYGGTQVGAGGAGEVTEVFYVFEDDLNLKAGLIKVTIPNVDYSKALLLYEQKVTEEVTQLIQKTKEEIASGKPQALSERQFQNDPTKNILCPEVLGGEFIIMPKVENAQGESVSLLGMSKKKVPVQEMATALLGATRGLAFLSDNGIIAADNSDRNTLDSVNGGVVIDLGGFISKKLLQDGIIRINDESNSSERERFGNKSSVGVKVADGEYTSFESPDFITAHIFAQELSGEIPVGVSHKISLARMIERYLGCVGYLTASQFKKFTNARYDEKLSFTPVNIAEDVFKEPGHLQLYNLYLKLFTAYKHPTRFIDGVVTNGVDQQYISMEEVEDALQEIIKSK